MARIFEKKDFERKEKRRKKKKKKKKRKKKRDKKNKKTSKTHPKVTFCVRVPYDKNLFWD